MLAAEDIEECLPFISGNLFRFHDVLSFSKYLLEMSRALHPSSNRH